MATSHNEPVLVVWNPSSETADIDAFRRQLERRDQYRIADHADADQGIDAVRQALREKIGTVVAAGGDGTAHTVANVLIESKSDARMGILPLGTGNDTCRTMGIPADPVEALSVLESGRTEVIDAIRIEADDLAEYFINLSAGGYSSEVMKAITDEVKERWKKLAYLRAAVSTVPDSIDYQTTIRFDDDRPVELSVVNVILGNGCYSAGGMPAAPAADPRDGLLDVLLFRDGSMNGFLEVVAGLVGNTLHQCQGVEYRQVRRLKIEATPKIAFSADGELLVETPVEFTVVPGVLRMIVGDDFPVRPAEAS